jgi:hypothetical protein
MLPRSKTASVPVHERSQAAALPRHQPSSRTPSRNGWLHRVHPSVRLFAYSGGAPTPASSIQPARADAYAGDRYEYEANQMSALPLIHSASVAPIQYHSPSPHYPGLGSGRPLSEPVRAQYEAGFGWDFSAVRLHTGGSAVEVARNAGAKAFTTSSHIVFGSQIDNPESVQHRAILGHELAHVIQQEKGAGMVAESGSPADRLSAAPTGLPQALPSMTGVNLPAPAELGIGGRSIRGTATVAAGTPAATRINWVVVGAPAGPVITVAPTGRRTATIQATAPAPAAGAPIPGAGAAFTIRAELAANAADNAVSAPIVLVGINNIAFNANPPLAAIASLIPAAPPAPPPGTGEPNRDSVAGNTVNVVVTTAPAGRPTSVSLRRSLGTTVAGLVITPGQTTGNALVRVIDNATRSQRNETLVINPVPLRMNSLAGVALAPPLGPYGSINTIGWARSDRTGNPLNRVVGETIQPGGRDDFGMMAGINAPLGPNAAPILALAVPANTWRDQLFTPSGPAAGPAGDANPINVNRNVGPGVPPARRLPQIWSIRQGFHWLAWSGVPNWSREFDRGRHVRSLIRTGPAAFGFRTQHIFPGARFTFNEAYTGPRFIILSAMTLTPNAPAATGGLAADNVATATITVNSTVAGRLINWSLLSGTIVFVGAVAAVPVAAPITVRADNSPGAFRIRAADSVFANRHLNGRFRKVPVVLRPITGPRSIAPGTNVTVVNMNADPGGRTIIWGVDAAAAAAGVTVVGGIPGAANAPARNATVTRPAGFTGRVTVTATDNVLAARTRSITITFR